MSSFLGTLQGISDGIIGGVQALSDPRFVESMKDDRKTSVKLQLAALAAAVVSVALLCLGMGLCAAGPIGMGFGIPLIIISLPALWASYNCYQVCSNMVEITKDPAKYVLLNDAVKIVERNKLISILEKNTLLFTPVLELLIK